MAHVKQSRPASTPEEENFRYFPDRLKSKLRKAQAMRGIFIEAPSGYGKTTVARELLLKNLPKGTIRTYHRCMEESPHAAWRNLCQTLQKIDEPTGTALLRLGLPDKDSMGDAGRRLLGMECEAPAWLVLDDFHQLAELAPASVWKALLENECPRLTTVLLSRPLIENLMPYEKSGFLRLEAKDLSLTEQECREYFAAGGTPLTEEDANLIHSRTGGWLFLLTLHLRHYRSEKTFAAPSDRDKLIQDVIWNKLDRTGQDFLLSLSPFDVFNPAQASRLPAVIMELERASMLHFDSEASLYYPHGALLDFTRAECRKLPQPAQYAIRKAAADWYAANNRRGKAIGLYYELREFEKILALDLSGLPDNRLLDMPDDKYAEALRLIVAHCDRDMKLKYPTSMIRIAFEFFGRGCFEDLTALRLEMESLLRQNGSGNNLASAKEDKVSATGVYSSGTRREPKAQSDAGSRQTDPLLGELLLLEAFTCYNDIAEMGERIKRASELTGGKTSLIGLDNSWTFGNPSVLCMYHREAGRLDAELADMDAYNPHYSDMAGGHGSGGPALMKAEALLSRGKAGDAEVFGHKARLEAATHSQISILIGVELFFGRLAIMRGNGAAYSAALASIASLAEKHPQKSNRTEAEVARSFLAGLLGRLPGKSPDAAEWLRQGPVNDFSSRIFTPAIPFAHLCRSRCLLLDGRPEVLLGESGAVLGMAAAMNCMLALIYGHIHTAAASSMRGKEEAAASALGKALDLALPDALYMPFVENFDMVGPVSKKVLSGKEHEKTLSSIENLAGRLQAGREAVLKEIQPSNPSALLTERELEVARLVAEGLSNKEIADTLHIKDGTVRDHLTHVYEKTGQSRSGLYKIFS
jgi:LuxR family maltose regulon positive regulatory protein